MSPKGKKATANKASKECSPVVTTGRTPVCSPLDDGLRSRMFNLSSNLSGSRPLPARRRSGGNEPLLSLDLDPPPKRRKQREPLNKENSSPPSLHGPSDPNLCLIFTFILTLAYHSLTLTQSLSLNHSHSVTLTHSLSLTSSHSLPLTPSTLLTQPHSRPLSHSH